MSSKEVVIRIESVGKMFHIYDAPADRLKQFLLPRLSKLLFRKASNYFLPFWALKDISLEVKKGQTLGILGRNGSGKSTLLQIVCGTLTPSSGEVESKSRVAALLELGSGFNPEFSGRDNIFLNAALLGLTQEETVKRYDAIVDFADIGPFLEQSVKTYSSGMVVRLAFAIAISVDAGILVIDEALAVGDELFQRKCYSKLETLKSQGVTILFVSHSASAILDLSDKALLLDRGEMLALGEPKYVVGQYQKLLYAPEELRESLRSELKETLVGSEGSDAVLAEDSGIDGNQNTDEFYDPGLAPESTIEYESHGGLIRNTKISTLDGVQVNNLVKGRVYLYSYEVHFNRVITNVQFGMMIKTTAGMELGGGTSSDSTKTGISETKIGETDQVRFEFRCALNAGVYYLNAGVVGTIAEEEFFIHRLLDCCCFRVCSEVKTCSSGIVDFDVRSKELSVG